MSGRLHHYWYACDKCGMPQLKAAKGGKCMLTPRCEGHLTVLMTQSPFPGMERFVKK